MDNYLQPTTNSSTNPFNSGKKKTGFDYDPALAALAQRVAASQQTPHSEAIKTATNIAVQAGADPAALVNAKHDLGVKDFIGLCERFVEQVSKGATGMFASAKDAFNQQKQQGQAQTDFSKMKPGDAIYFAADASNGGYGHTGIYSGNGKFISATNNGVQEHPIDQWSKSTGQKPVGFVPQG